MKFEYDKEEDRGEVVAFIDADGDLWFRCDGKESAIMSTGGDITPQYGRYLDESMAHCGAIKKFYRGDKITITF